MRSPSLSETVFTASATVAGLLAGGAIGYGVLKYERDAHNKTVEGCAQIAGAVVSKHVVIEGESPCIGLRGVIFNKSDGTYDIPSQKMVYEKNLITKNVDPSALWNIGGALGGLVISVGALATRKRFKPKNEFRSL